MEAQVLPSSMILDPQNYSVANRNHQTFAFRTLAESFQFFTRFKSPLVMVDLGCGSGNVTKMMTSSIPNIHLIYGLDPTDKMIEIAKMRNSDPRIIYEKACAENAALWPKEILVKTNKVHVVTSFATLHFFNDAQLALNNARMALKSDGILVGYTFAKPFPALTQLSNYLRYESPYLLYYKDKPFFCQPLFPEGNWIGAESVEEEFKLLLSRAKLQPLKIDFFPAIFNFRQGEMRDFVRIFIQKHMDCIPNGDQIEFIKDCCRVFEKASNCHPCAEFGLNSLVSEIDNLLIRFVAEIQT